MCQESGHGVTAWFLLRILQEAVINMSVDYGAAVILTARLGKDLLPGCWIEDLIQADLGWWKMRGAMMEEGSK